MKTLSGALWVARKDLRIFCRDRTGMLLGFLLPIALVTVFGSIMNWVMGSGGGMSSPILWIVDEDQTDRSRTFVDVLREAEMIRLKPAAKKEPETADSLRSKISDGEAHHALILPKGFGAKIDAGEVPDLTMVRDPGRSIEDRLTRIAVLQALMAASEGKLWPHTLGNMMRKMGMEDAQVESVIGLSRSIQTTISMFVSQSEPGESSDSAPPDDATKEIESEASGFDMTGFMDDMIPLQNEDVAPPNRSKELTHQLSTSVAGVMVMMLMFGLMACSALLLHEREGGTLRRLLTTGLPRDSVLWGKFFFAMIMGSFQLTVLLVYGEIVFKVGLFNDPATLIVVSLAWIVAATSFGLLIASVARTAKQAEGLSTLLILIMAALGGCWIPLQAFDLPPFAQIITKCTLTYWAMSAYQGMLWNQLSFQNPQMLTCIAVLLGFAIVATALARWFYRRNYVAG